MIRLATVQSAIDPDVRANGRRVRMGMERAAHQGARLVQFPEAALSGYAAAEINDWADVDWAALNEELAATAMLAKRLGIWVVLGANHRLGGGRWPQNSLYVISDTGVLAGRYSKRFCSNTEVTYWYTPGQDPLAFDVDGVRFGCALCIEVVFPHLFAEYARLGVTCLLLSCYSPDPIHGIMARAHAATNCYWVSLSNSSVCSSGLPSMLVGPDGHPVTACPPGADSMVIDTIDPNAPRYRVALRMAKPWRARAMSGDIYADRTAEHA